ncbi:hypothetical protein AB6D10_00175 [Vibrio splendidus]
MCLIVIFLKNKNNENDKNKANKLVLAPDTIIRTRDSPMISNEKNFAYKLSVITKKTTTKYKFKNMKKPRTFGFKLTRSQGLNGTNPCTAHKKNKKTTLEKQKKKTTFKLSEDWLVQEYAEKNIKDDASNCIKEYHPPLVLNERESNKTRDTIYIDRNTMLHFSFFEIVKKVIQREAINAPEDKVP